MLLVSCIQSIRKDRIRYAFLPNAVDVGDVAQLKAKECLLIEQGGVYDVSCTLDVALAADRVNVKATGPRDRWFAVGLVATPARAAASSTTSSRRT